MLNIQGLQKTTLLDYPGHVAATVFLGGCNMRCKFCHNMEMVQSAGPAQYSEDEILGFLKKRRGILEGVCITGGEPTLYPDLPDLIRHIKDIGMNVKLDTNGTNPEMLSSLAGSGLIDYAAMDIKSSFSGYPKVCGTADIDLAPIKESIGLLLGGICDYEFRTTAVEEYLDIDDVREIAQMIKGAERYFLQGYVESEFVPDKTLHPVPKEKLLQYQKELSKYIKHVEIRGL
ncbi:MAG: anaerobic ribonucleoside-triphosphate reductase activating protein [Lachnospiraceae bacterium]|nr:anaerobic ribonucleoside-triphosphate reductase activating protein [Lachnospiraceae bacterium]